MSEIFLFKFKDKVLATISYSLNSFHIETINVDHSVVFFMLRDDYMFNKWVEDRRTSIYRANYSELMKLAGVHNDLDFVLATLCLSVADSFWLVKSDNNISWNSVSLFQNSFSSAYTKVASGQECFKGIVIKTPSPEMNVGGSSFKYVKRKDGVVSLYKSLSPGGLLGVETSFSGAFSEYFVTQLLDFIAMTNYYVRYDLVSHSTSYTDVVCSKCDFITNEDISMLDLEDILIYESEDNYDHYSQYIDELLHKFPESSDYLRFMMIVDCLTLNIDRHSENIAFLYDNAFNIKIAPMYDFDHSLFYDIGLKNITEKKYLEYIKNHVPRTYVNHTFEDQLRLCADNTTKPLLLHIYNNFNFIQHKTYRIDELRLENLNKIFKTTVKHYIDCLN